MADAHIEGNWPELIALEKFLNALTSGSVGLSIPQLVEALAAHEQHGGRVPWK